MCGGSPSRATDGPPVQLFLLDVDIALVPVELVSPASLLARCGTNVATGHDGG